MRTHLSSGCERKRKARYEGGLATPVYQQASVHHLR